LSLLQKSLWYIYEVGRSPGHVPIIDNNVRRKEMIPLASHEAVHFRERIVADCFNSRLKEGFGASNVMVRGAVKVRLHRLLGLVALFADQLLELVSWARRTGEGQAYGSRPP
jgi:hypothetical protein